MGDKCRIKLTPNCRRRLGKNCRSTDRDIYREAFNSAWEEYKEPSERREGATREETAHKVAWSAVKKVYEKDSKGNWVKK